MADSQQPTFKTETFDDETIASKEAAVAALSLARGIMAVAKLDCWDDLGENAYEVLEEVEVVVSSAQAELLAAHEEKLFFLRRTRRKNSFGDSRKQLLVALCSDCRGWRLVTTATGGRCSFTYGCKGTMSVPAAAKPDRDTSGDSGPDPGATHN